MEKIKKISWQQHLKSANSELKERVSFLEKTLRNVRLNTGIECPLCSIFDNKIFPSDRMIVGMLSLQGKSIRHFYKCNNCNTTWE